MSKPTLFGLVVFVAVLLICAALIFIHRSLGTGTTAERQPLPTASPSSAVAVAPVPATPVPGPTESDADRMKRERLRAKSKELKQTNAALDEALRKADYDKRRAEESTQSMAMLTGKLLDANLNVPKTTSEAGSLAGQNLGDIARFKQKWGDFLPAAGTPEADAYAREKEALVGESAALLKFMSDENNTASLFQQDGMVQFQVGSLASALDLGADQAQGINTALEGYYQQFFARGLNWGAQPQTGLDAWQQQRAALSQQSYGAVSAFLTPQQMTAFQQLYPAAESWMSTATIGDIPGLDGMY